IYHGKSFADSQRIYNLSCQYNSDSTVHVAITPNRSPYVTDLHSTQANSSPRPVARVANSIVVKNRTPSAIVNHGSCHVKVVGCLRELVVPHLITVLNIHN